MISEGCQNGGKRNWLKVECNFSLSLSSLQIQYNLNTTRTITQVFPCHSVGAEPVAGSGSGLPHHRQALHKCPTSQLSFSGYELCVLQPLHLCLAAQQDALAPERLPLSWSQSPEGNGGESNVQQLISNRPCMTHGVLSLPTS